jgi:hypothetical protein
MAGIQVQHPRCPFCHEPVRPEQIKAPCHACMGWNHEACWTEHGGCAACGQKEAGGPTSAPVAARSAEGGPLPDAALGPWLLGRSRGSEAALGGAVLAAARYALPDDAPERGALAILAEWVDCPCREHARAAKEAAAVARQLSLDGGTLTTVRYATLAAVALRMPAIKLDVQGVEPFVHALRVVGAALAARRGATSASDADRAEVQAVVARALG